MGLYNSRIDFSVYDTGQWKKQNDSFVSELSWVWVNHYPYGYSNKEQNWLYISARNNEQVFAYGKWNETWIELARYQHNWNKQYLKWSSNPDPYGGLEVLDSIKQTRENGNLKLWLTDKNISDLSPVAGLQNIEGLYLSGNDIIDLSPLANLTSLTSLSLANNEITDLSSLSDLKNITELWLNGNRISDLSPLSGLHNLKSIVLSQNKITDLFGFRTQ